MSKKILSLLLVLALLTGCATIKKYADKGIKASKKAATKYVDKEAGSGTAKDFMAMKDDKQKLDKLLPYYIKANKMYDDKVLTKEERNDLKEQFSQYYQNYQKGKLSETEYDKKCTRMLEAEEKEVKKSNN